jgi:NAD(P)-dependent dehydrogenase (short-subunit alcohol dehydrogenase family)
VAALSALPQHGAPAQALSGRTALITGATGGLGAGFAGGLARAGAEVVLMARDGARLDALRARLCHGGHRVRSAACDVSDVSATAMAIEQLDRLDILVNNAGANMPESFLDVTPERYDHVADVDVRGAFFCAQAAARKMVAAEGGVIVNVTSQMGHVGGRQRSVYCSTKHALEGLTKAMALELTPLGVRVCSLAPTYVHTPMIAPCLADAAFRAGAGARIPAGRVAEVDDVVGALIFLVSPAARFVCGSSLLVDGGYTAQ